MFLSSKVENNLCPMPSAIYRFKDELYLCPPAHLESSSRIQLSKIILPTYTYRKIQQMVLDIGWALMAERLMGFVFSFYFISQCSGLKLVLLNVTREKGCLLLWW